MSKKTIMIIEDDLDSQVIFEEILRSEGFDVAQVSNGRVALQEIDQKRPDLLVMDLSFAYISAEEFIQELKKKSYVPPLMVVSGRSDIEGYAKKLGARCFLKKPFEYDHFLEQIKSCL